LQTTDTSIHLHTRFLLIHLPFWAVPLWNAERCFSIGKLKLRKTLRLRNTFCRWNLLECKIMLSNIILLLQASLINIRHRCKFDVVHKRHMIRDSSVGIATGYGVDDRGSITGRGKTFFCYPQRPDRLWAHSAFYPMGTGDSSSLGKAAEAWSWPLTSI
jgi:hypothetical protein